MTGWTAFAAGLATELRELPVNSTLIIVESHPPGQRRYVQFYKTADVLAAQLVSDKYLEEAVRSDDAGRHAIVHAGWGTPDADSSFLWWADFAAPITAAEYRRAATMSVTGLRDGYRLDAPDGLEYDAWIDTAGNQRLDLPELGITRRRAT